jgi:hypothetical protein
MPSVRPTTADAEVDEESILYLEKKRLVQYFVACIIASVGLAFIAAPAEWTLFRTMAAGVIGGSWAYICLFINRVLMA